MGVPEVERSAMRQRCVRGLVHDVLARAGRGPRHL